MKKRFNFIIGGVVIVCLIVGLMFAVPTMAASECAKCGHEFTGSVGEQSELSKALGLDVCIDCWLDSFYGADGCLILPKIALLGEDGYVLPSMLPPGSGGGMEIHGNEYHSPSFAELTHNHSGIYEPADAAIQTHITSNHAPSDAQKNSDITKSEIEAKLIGEISTHTHAGGGSIVIKAGTVTTNSSGESTVTFNTPFPDTNYAISLVAITTADTVTCMANSKTVNGFSIETEDDGGKTESNIVVNWIATPYSNP